MSSTKSVPRARDSAPASFRPCPAGTTPTPRSSPASRSGSSRQLVRAARSTDLPRPGSFRAVDVGGESVLIVRGPGPELRAFFNVCRHRGARLCTEDSGEVRRAFQCPYHAWTYDLDGKLIAAPNLTKMPDIDRVEYGLRRVASRSGSATCGCAWPTNRRRSKTR